MLCAWVQSLHLFIILLICFDGTHIVAHTALQVLCAWVQSLHLFIVLLNCFGGKHHNTWLCKCSQCWRRCCCGTCTITNTYMHTHTHNYTITHTYTHIFTGALHLWEHKQHPHPQQHLSSWVPRQAIGGHFRRWDAVVVI